VSRPARRQTAAEVYLALQEARSVADCASIFKRAVQAYDVDVFACGEIDLLNKSVVVFHIIEWPDDWRNYYMRSKLVEFDPTFDRLRALCKPFTWTELKRELRLDNRGREAFRQTAKKGWREGLVVPVDRGGSFCGLVSLVGRAPRFLSAERLQLCVMSEALLGRVRALGPPETYPVPPCGLSPREIQAVRLVALGQTDAEIAAALKISRATAHQYVETAKKRLHARSRAQLAAKAVTLGLAASSEPGVLARRR
jgi:LuxR family quorum sensing-dependent transcriptional regulator